ncbi:MAG: response regulator transcription factor [Bacteroidales bacterium]|nr:response regulator transcription factor [Bacteroidales bacterium]
MESSQKIRVLIVEDHPMYRVGLRMGLRYSDSNCEVAAEVEDVHQAVTYLQDHGKDVDLILLDYYLPDGSALDVISVAKSVSPEVKVLLITGYVLDNAVMSQMEMVIDGYISKTVKPEELRVCIDSLFKNRDFRKNEGNTVSLTPREIEIIRLCAEGKSAQEIAEALNLSKRTIEGHKVRIFSKLSCKSTLDLVNYAYRNGLVV